MKKLLAAAVLLLVSSAAQAQYTFEYGGKTIRVDPDRGTVQIPGEGIYEIVVAPPNPSLLYMFYRKKIFKSTNRGTTWTQTAFSYTGKADPNDSYRFWGQKMAVDPANASVVYVGTVSDGLYVTSDGDASWSLVSGVGVPGAQGITAPACSSEINAYVRPRTDRGRSTVQVAGSTGRSSHGVKQ